MKAKPENPFRYSGLVDREHAAPREELESALRRYFATRQNLLVQGPRRTGKTSLIVNTFRAMQEKRKCWLVEVDFYGVKDRTRVVEKIYRAIGSLPLASGPKLKVQRLLGQLSEIGLAGFKAGWRKTEVGIEDVLEILDEIGKNRPVVAFFDEFQALTAASDPGDILGSLRSVIQRQPEIFYLFAGSEQNSLREMFFVQKNPFLKSVAVLDVGPIPRADFIPWLEGQFVRGRRKVIPTVWDPLFELVDDIPGDVQQICHTLWETTGPGMTVDLESLQKSVDKIVSMQDSSFRDLWAVLPQFQRLLIRGLAQNPGLGHTSQEFRRASGISTGATASRAMESMLQKGVLWKREGRILFANPFLRYWLLHQE